MCTASKIGLAMNVPPLRATLPASGEGPTRATMESGFLKLHGRATAVNAATGETVRLRCFSMNQPFASLLAAGVKTIESRNGTMFQGSEGEVMLLHVGKR